MKRILIVLVIAILLLCGCGKTEETQERFVIEYKQTFDGIGNLRIIRDTETGKAYLFAKYGYAGGFVILEDGE